MIEFDHECEMTTTKALSSHLYCLPCPVMYEKAASRPTSSQPSIPDTNQLISGSTNTDARVQRNRNHVRPLVLLSLHSAPFYYPLFSCHLSLFTHVCSPNRRFPPSKLLPLFILGYLGMCVSMCLLICMTRSRQPITWVEHFKVSFWLCAVPFV